MIINHNINAMNSHRNSAMSLQNVRKSMEKLSSGTRINRAGDDAAGLSISEKMRGQIRGLEQASRNVQDGISLLQTAEGALNETHSIVQRMRELTVQSANDTNTEDDRNKIQDEIEQLIDQLDTIGNETEFNNVKLLNAGVSNEEAVKNIVNGLKTGWLEKAGELIKNAYNLEGTGTDLKVTFIDGAPYDTLASVGGDSAALELTIDVKDFEQGDGESGNNIHGKLYDDRIIAHEMTHAVMNSALTIPKMNELHNNNKVWFIEGTAEFIAGADERVKNVIGNNLGTNIDPSKLDALAKRADELLNGAKWSGSDLDYAAGYLMVKYIASQGTDLKNVMQQIKTNGNANVGLETAIDITNLRTNFEDNIKNYVQNDIELNWGKDELDVGSALGSDHGGSAINAEKVIDGTIASKDQPLKGFNIIWPNASNSSSKINIQLGANNGQSLEIQLKDMRSSAIGLSGLKVLDGLKASEAIKKCDEAINIVSNFRSSLGAYQNRLEHSMTNLNNSCENLTSSESRIRDTDMSKEMLKFSKENIINQAAQSMLAQANQQTQGVLQLLR